MYDVKNPKTQSRLYYQVASVDSLAVQEVFRLAQFTHELSKDEEAKLHWEFPYYRSMMVGDMVENESGIYRCQRDGWLKL